MISLSIAIAITILVILFTRKYLKASFMRILWAGFCGILTGSMLDLYLGQNMGLWYYTHHEYFSPDYFALIYSGWFVFGILVYHVSEFIKLKIRNYYTHLVVLTVVVASVNEFIGCVRDIWRYDASFWLIVVGWFVYMVLLDELYQFNPRLEVNKNEKPT